MRIAIVVQRYGLEVNGGAELAARWLAEHLARMVDVTVLTTCAVDYTTWANSYAPGESELHGVKIRRFPVDEIRNWRDSQKTTGRFLLRERTIEEEIDWIQKEGPFSSSLLQFIKQSEPEFDAFIFFTYLYATTFFGLPMVAHKAILVPTAHDEPFLYMNAYRALLHLPRILVYLTESEKQIVNRVTGNADLPSDVIAVGVTGPEEISAERFRQKYDLDDPFILFGGRISEGKNVPELLDFFFSFHARNDIPLKLVLMGKSNISIPSHPDIISVGYLSEQDKFDALSAATIFVLPSLYESLSIAVLESWLVGTPVIVNGLCEVTRQQCRRSNGGLYYTSYEEFEATVRLLLFSNELRRRLGHNGQQFVNNHYHWDVVLSKYQRLLNYILTQPAISP